ncbi:hypothetical protein C4587_00910 [Candidatus Parcubacteria bacterium]|nr:MAG: hypothetical protein C4587_00910 [Candidatus Parcubacteria bacterium]
MDMPENERLARRIEALRLAREIGIGADVRESLPDDIRAKGWSVAVHNDYRLDREPHTFWLFTKNGRAVKGEGRTDAEALNQVRAVIANKSSEAR